MWHVARATDAGLGNLRLGEWPASKLYHGYADRIHHVTLRYQPITDFCFSADFAANGKTGIACYVEGGKWDTAISSGTGWLPISWSDGPAPPSPLERAYDNRGTPIRRSCITGNFQGNGKISIACHVGGGKWQIASLTSGTSWSKSSWENGPSVYSDVGNSCISGGL